MFKFMPWLLFKLFLSFYQTVSQKIFRCFKINQEKTLNGYKLLHWEEEKKKRNKILSVSQPIFKEIAQPSDNFLGFSPCFQS